MSGSEMEVLVLHALRLVNSLYRPRSSGENTPKAISIPLHQPRSVTWVKLIQGRLLIVASSDAHQSTLALWSIPLLFENGHIVACWICKATTQCLPSSSDPGEAQYWQTVTVHEWSISSLACPLSK
ncbi:uncharacterized protein PHACADRAFT_248756 [Phanerochaete carnosa HHB-10118-sp]|uniref:Uncharacterized protein n=1 Tax=Phanerochaete carnosa (strain HHB-10118-sp) TaxID=650164 RepID=K5WD50_PHACS|nr:uncharacterized protein PHACADRAFT_248756 [Phanerochaete carnosa HHB-10118-sp]EKM61863.1 hypothetical protein PHACADRAFT_248756 [Phanerochaete carnosa HHB-10118-sp]